MPRPHRGPIPDQTIGGPVRWTSRWTCSSASGSVSVGVAAVQATRDGGSCEYLDGMEMERNKSVVGEFDELGNGGGDLGRLDTLCTPDMVNHALAPHMPAGIEGTRR